MNTRIRAVERPGQPCHQRGTLRGFGGIGELLQKCGLPAAINVGQCKHGAHTAFGAEIAGGHCIKSGKRAIVQRQRLAQTLAGQLAIEIIRMAGCGGEILPGLFPLAGGFRGAASPVIAARLADRRLRHGAGIAEMGERLRRLVQPPQGDPAGKPLRIQQCRTFRHRPRRHACGIQPVPGQHGAGACHIARAPQGPADIEPRLQPAFQTDAEQPAGHARRCRPG